MSANYTDIETHGTFDLEQIYKSGQVFSWIKTAENAYTIVTAGHVVHARQLSAARVRLDVPQQTFRRVWAAYFDLGTDYGPFIAAPSKAGDAFLEDCAEAAAGVRILKQELFETLVSFIVSQNNNIPRIKKTLALMRQNLGKQIEPGVWTFPTPAALQNIADLQGLGLGYRDKYVAFLAGNVVAGRVRLDELAALPHKQAREYLKGVYGVGDKVADCVCLFGLGQKEAFPRDTWINRIVAEQYNGRFPIEQHDGFAGVEQQYIFYAAQNRGKR